MTYKDLLLQLQQLNEDQLNQDVAVYDNYEQNYHKLKKLLAELQKLNEEQLNQDVAVYDNYE